MKDNADPPLDNQVLRAIEVYNKYRSPEATAKLVKTEKDGFIIEFEGRFCQSCGVNEYFEDFIYDLEDINRNLRAEIKAVESTGPQSFRVHYAVMADFSGGDVEAEELFREFLQVRGLSFEDYLASNTCTKDVIKFHFQTWLLERKPKR
ncbi:MAG: hypothetical protein CW716_02995 [Candidatus Bathyarchaeum sp.]|nr:MAG: hypothetical protein CW716_02995 [Candidatus Bathyarchaeum sp.]